MLFRKLALLCLVLAVFCSAVRSQTPDAPTDADKQKKQKETEQRIQQMLDLSINDANSLRLPENKAVVFALAGEMYWRFDEKRARDLFRSAANEILSYNSTVERDEAATAINGFALPDPSSDVRTQVLTLVAGRDPQLAYQMLLQTRPSKLAEAMARGDGQGPAQNNRGSGGGARAQFIGPQRGGNSGPSGQQVSEELALEQQFAAMAAANDPDAAIKLIKDSISKGVTTQVLGLLQDLYKKDDKKANELAADVVGALISADMTANPQQLNVALSFLNFATRPKAPDAASGQQNATPTGGLTGGQLPPKQFAFTDSQIRDLANKIANTLTSAIPNPQTANLITRALPTIQKVAPERAVLLNQKLAESQKTQRNPNRAGQQQVRQFDRNATPEEILAQIPNLRTANEKRIAYQSVANKAGQIKDDDARAQSLIDQIGDEKIRASAQQQLNAGKANRAATAGKLDEAKAAISLIPDRHTRIQRLVALALTFQKNKTEKDRETAESVMKEARSLIKEIPDDEDDIADLMEVVRGYATVDPGTAFRLAEPMFDIFNDTINAAAVLSKYNKRDRTFKKSELIMRLNGGGNGGGLGVLGNTVMLFRYIPQIQLLAKADLDRMSTIADRFTRGDARTIVRLFVLQGYLGKEKKANAATPAPQPAANPPGN